jgi:hypothetical protein
MLNWLDLLLLLTGQTLQITLDVHGSQIDEKFDFHPQLIGIWF